MTTRATETRPGEPMCGCGHRLYAHYMCADQSRCLTDCGCAAFKPVRTAPRPTREEYARAARTHLAMSHAITAYGAGPTTAARGDLLRAIHAYADAMVEGREES